MPRTRKPCPGCGEGGRWRDVDSVCGSCKALLEDGKRFRELYESDDADHVRVVIPDAAHRLPYLRHGSRERIDAFQRAILNLAASIASGKDESIENRSYGHQPLIPLGRPERIVDQFYGASALMTKDAHRHMARLYQAALDLVESAYKEGFRDGRSILIGLARGEIAPSEFEARS